MAQSQPAYHSASSSLSAPRPSSCFDVDNEETDACENVVVADEHADVRASAATTDDNDDDADDGDSMAISEKSSALHPWPRLLLTLISLLMT